jgi:pyruvate dehydrogenase E1 component alpha subunit
MINRFRQMLLIRRFEEKAGQLFGMGMVDGYCHLCIGQEASVVGVQSALKAGDSTIAGYRAHGHMLASGMEPSRVMAELCGRGTGYSGGKGGSMHMFDIGRRFFGGHGIVGAQVPIGAGIAFTHRYRRNNGICVTYFGDGAADQGQVHETMVLAARLSLPILFVIENNSEEDTGLNRRGEPFGIEGHQVDGMDVEAVADIASILVPAVRAGAPSILETRTQRFRGHSLANPAKYGASSATAVDRSRDPIDLARDRLLEQGRASEEDLKAIDKEIRQICNDAANMALDSPEPANKVLMDHIVA